MGKDIYAQKLAWFKQNEKPEAVLSVDGNPERINIVVAWTNVEIRRVEKITGMSGESDNEAWEWLWKNSHYSSAELMEKSGLRPSEAVLANKMKPLVGNRVLYPDGTLNSSVQR